MTTWSSLLIAEEFVSSDFAANFVGLEEFHSDKSKCQEHFDIYKECKKKEVMDFPQIFQCSVLLLLYKMEIQEKIVTWMHKNIV